MAYKNYRFPSKSDPHSFAFDMDSLIVRAIDMDTCTIEESWTKSNLDEATDLFNVFILR